MNTALVALIRNDLRLFISDRRAVMITILVPVMIASFFAMIFGGSSGTTARSAIHLILADNDRSPISQEIVANLQKDDTLSVQVTTEAEARSLVTHGKAPVALILPAQMGQEATRTMFAGPNVDRPHVALLYDPSHGPEYQLVRGLVLQQVMQVVSRHVFSSDSTGPDVDDRLRSIQADTTISPADKSALTDLLQSVKHYYGRTNASPSIARANNGGALQMPVTITDEAVTGHVAASNATTTHSFAGMAVQGVFFFAIDAAMGMLRDRRLGLWKRLRAAPLSRGTLLGGKVASTTLIAMLVLGTVFLVGALAFKLRVGGSFLGFLLLILCTGLMAATFGLLIAALGRTEAQSRGYAIPAVLAMSILGGAWFPSFLMPRWIQTVSLAIPSRYALDGFDAVTWRGFGLDAALIPCLALLGFAFAFGTFAMLRFRWDAE